MVLVNLLIAVVTVGVGNPGPVYSIDLQPYADVIEWALSRDVAALGTADVLCESRVLSAEDQRTILEHVLYREEQRGRPLGYQITATRQPDGVKIVLVAQHTKQSVDFFLVKLFERGQIEPMWTRYGYVCSYWPCGKYYIRILKEQRNAISFVIGSHYQGMMEVAVRKLDGTSMPILGDTIRFEFVEDRERAVLLVWLRRNGRLQPCAYDESKKCLATKLSVVVVDSELQEVFSTTANIEKGKRVPDNKIEMLGAASDEWVSNWPGSVRRGIAK